MKSFQDIVDAFGGVSAFADAMGRGRLWAKKVRERDSLNAEFWPQVVELAAERNIPLTLADMHEIWQVRRVIGEPKKRQPEKRAA